MDLKIDETRLNEAVQRRMTESIESALGSWKVEMAIAQTLTEEVSTGAVAEAVREAVSSIDTQTLVGAMAREMSKAIVRSVAHIVEESTLDIIVKLRSPSLYGDELARYRERVRAELRGCAKDRVEAHEEIACDEAPEPEED